MAIASRICSVDFLGGIASCVVTGILRTGPLSPACVLACVILNAVLFVAGTKLYAIKVRKRRVITGIARLTIHRLTNCFHKRSYSRTSCNHEERSATIVGHLTNPNTALNDAVACLQKIGHVLPVLGTILVFYAVSPQATVALPQIMKANLSSPPEVSMFTPEERNYLFIALSITSACLSLMTFVVVQPTCRLKLSLFQKIGTSNLLLSVCAITGAVLSAIRERQLPNETYSKMSIMCYEAFTSLLLYFSEIIIIVAGSAAAYKEAPDGLEVVFYGLFLCTCGVGGMVGSAVFRIACLPSLTNELQKNREWYFTVLLTILIINALYIIFLTKRHPFEREESDVTEENARYETEGGNGWHQEPADMDTVHHDTPQGACGQLTNTYDYQSHWPVSSNSSGIDFT